MFLAALLYFNYDRVTSVVGRLIIWAILVLNIVAFSIIEFDNILDLGSGAKWSVFILLCLSFVMVIALAGHSASGISLGGGGISLGGSGMGILGVAYALCLATSTLLKYAIFIVSYFVVDIDAGAINGIFTVIDIAAVLSLSSVYSREDKLELLNAQVSCACV
jgi:hypothetical protein